MVGTRVVVVSADAAERHDLWLWLLSAGCDPVTAADFHAGKRLLHGDIPDLLVTDVRLDAYNGLHLVILGKARDANLKAIVISDPDPVLESEARAAGARFQTRPVSQTQFLQTIVEVLTSKRAIRRAARKRISPIQALVDNVQARIVEVSYDGLRIEMPGIEGRTLPRTFTIRVLSSQLALAAQWVWTAQQTAEHSVSAYGVRLGWNDPEACAQWRALVDFTAGAVSIVM